MPRFWEILSVALFPMFWKVSRVLESIFPRCLSLTFSRSRNTFLRRSLPLIPKYIVDAGFRYFVSFSRRIKKKKKKEEMNDMQLSSLE